MILPRQEPVVSVGLLEAVPRVCFELKGEYLCGEAVCPAGRYEARARHDAVVLFDENGCVSARQPELCLVPLDSPACSFAIENISIGRSFHWERPCRQEFRGTLFFMRPAPGSLTAINRIHLERYLEAVVCSEMSPQSPPEFLKAHCVISRSWLLAQLQRKQASALRDGLNPGGMWTDAGVHRDFDVCADDHCQRYHGIGAVNSAACDALEQSRGEALVHDGAVCDTRFSKCCGGITERFSTAWEDRDVPYLRPVADCGSHAAGGFTPVGSEQDARRFICSSPRAYCNVEDRELLERILPDFDRETRSFFRWTAVVSQTELQDILLNKTGIDFGAIRAVEPLERGPSGRLYRIKISGEKQQEVFGKELEVRRILSHTHLYSSAFVIDPLPGPAGIPDGFRLRGAGWGHGVGLCQIGAAAMAAGGKSYREILAHYFRGAVPTRLY